MAIRPTVPASVPGFSTAQTATINWVDSGNQITTLGWDRIVFHPNITKNSSADIRLRVTYETTSGGTEDRLLLIKDVSASVAKVEAAYYEFNVDANIKPGLAVELGGAIPYVQLQFQTGTVGATGATLDSVKYNLVRDN